MKKLIGIILTLCLTFSCVALVGCGGGSKTELTKQDYANVLGCMDATLTNTLSGGASVQSADGDTFGASLYTVTDDDYIDIGSNPQMLGGAIWMARFMKNICNNSTFEITTPYCYGIANDGDGHTYKMCFSFDYDQTKNIVYISIYVLQIYNQSNTDIFFNYEMNYDFNANTMNWFNLYGYMGKGDLSAAGVNSFKYANNQLKMLNPLAEGFLEFSQIQIDALTAMKPTPWSETLADYSTEYLTANPMQ